MEDPDFKNAREAFEHAWRETMRYGNDALEALQKAELVSTEEARRLFKAAADRALQASENWRQSAELAREVMQEIVSGIPRKP